ncbi:tyrosine-protein phosphatase [Staphylococcus caeli]|uniref:tyrosine-protein phosphatase n=1 Tax=Staphylococcus caeli TaxID=2201815 RepID=UPI003F544FAB
MIDIHNHILVDIDDGPKTDEDAIKLIQQAYDEGITRIVATPHHLHTRYDNPIAKVKQKIDDLKALEGVKALGVNIYPGQEIRITDQIINNINEGEVIGINNSRYLLIELPSNEVPQYTQRLFYEIQSMGYVPIIAHPERNKAIAQNLDLLFELINGGALSQITSSSLNGSMGKKVRALAIQMIENNLTHFVSSDAHSVEARPFIMKSMWESKKLKNYHEEMNDFLNNADLVINDKKITKQIPTQDYKQKKWFGIL